MWFLKPASVSVCVFLLLPWATLHISGRVLMCPSNCCHCQVSKPREIVTVSKLESMLHSKKKSVSVVVFTFRVGGCFRALKGSGNLRKELSLILQWSFFSAMLKRSMSSSSSSVKKPVCMNTATQSRRVKVLFSFIWLLVLDSFGSVTGVSLPEHRTGGRTSLFYPLICSGLSISPSAEQKTTASIKGLGLGFFGG